MKEIISILILIGLSSLYEWGKGYLKNRKGMTPDKSKAMSEHRRAVESHGTTAELPAGSFMDIIRRVETLSVKSQATDRDVEPFDLPVVVPPVVDSVEQTQNNSVTDNIVDIGVGEESAAKEDRNDVAHYERWRQAMIDTVILTPKFNP